YFTEIALAAIASCGFALGTAIPDGRRTAGTGPAPRFSGSGTCTVFFALPHAARTVAIAPEGGGSFLLPGSTSTVVHADNERFRPLIHQLSVISTPAIVPADIVL